MIVVAAGIYNFFEIRLANKCIMVMGRTERLKQLRKAK